MNLTMLFLNYFNPSKKMKGRNENSKISFKTESKHITASNYSMFSCQESRSKKAISTIIRKSMALFVKLHVFCSHNKNINKQPIYKTILKTQNRW
jgi:hypothetical protein